MNLPHDGPKNGDYTRYVDDMVRRQASALQQAQTLPAAVAPRVKPSAARAATASTKPAPTPPRAPDAAPAPASLPDPAQALREVLGPLLRRGPLVLIAVLIALPILWQLFQDWRADDLLIVGAVAAIIAFRWWRG